MQRYPIYKSITVEVNFVTVTTGASYYFKDVPQLRGVKVYMVAAYSGTQITKTSTLNTVASQTNIAEALVTFSVGSQENIFQMPYYDLIPSLNGGFIREFAGQEINITKSYVTLVNNTISNGQSVLFNFYYDDRTNNGNGKCGC